MSGAICGGNHTDIMTKKQARKHIADDLDNGLACIDCWCGIPFGFQRNKPKVKKG